jgi:hypothetical protein
MNGTENTGRPSRTAAQYTLLTCRVVDGEYPLLVTSTYFSPPLAAFS